MLDVSSHPAFRVIYNLMKCIFSYEDFKILESKNTPGFVKTLVLAVRKRRSSEATRRLVKSHKVWITSPQGQRLLMTMGILGVINAMLAREKLQLRKEKMNAGEQDDE